MIALSSWEQFIIAMALSFLTMLQSHISNPTELAALNAVIVFLQRLMGGTVQAKEA